MPSHDYKGKGRFWSSEDVVAVALECCSCCCFYTCDGGVNEMQFTNVRPMVLTKCSLDNNYSSRTQHNPIPTSLHLGNDFWCLTVNLFR